MKSCVFVCVRPPGKPAYLHIGEEVDGVDMRAEVGLLTRNILIRGEMEPTCYGNEACNFFSFDTFGGHLKVTDPPVTSNTHCSVKYHLPLSCNASIRPLAHPNTDVHTLRMRYYSDGTSSQTLTLCQTSRTDIFFAFGSCEGPVSVRACVCVYMMGRLKRLTSLVIGPDLTVPFPSSPSLSCRRLARFSTQEEISMCNNQAILSFKL